MNWDWPSYWIGFATPFVIVAIVAVMVFVVSFAFEHPCGSECLPCDRDYDEGVVVCADCIEALRYAGIGLDGDAYVGDLQCTVDMWAQNTLWHAFWTPERVTICEADCARRYLDRSGNKDVDPACVNGSRPYHAGARTNGEATCAKPPANGLTPRACTGNVWNVEAKRYGMRSWTHRPLWNVNASTRGFDIAPEPATRRMASAF